MNISNDIDISVVLTTRNRADVLGRTLENFCRVDSEGINVEFNISDNGSTDDTKKVIESFKSKLPIRYYYEPRAGQNRARNCVLAKMVFGRIIAFTDDDVKPDKNWLKANIAVCERWPDHQVFGGRIEPLWPDDNTPDWTKISWVSEIGFAAHDHGSTERVYPEGKYPFSPNMWFRREIFSDGRRFNEAIGPQPGNYIMGSETSFLTDLKREGYKIVYCPESMVRHYAQPHQISQSNMLRRGYRCGKAGPRLNGPCRRELLDKRPWVWLGLRCVSLTKATVRYLIAACHISGLRRFELQMGSLIDLGYNVESIRVGWEKLRGKKHKNV